MPYTVPMQRWSCSAQTSSEQVRHVDFRETRFYICTPYPSNGLPTFPRWNRSNKGRAPAVPPSVPGCRCSLQPGECSPGGAGKCMSNCESRRLLMRRHTMRGYGERSPAIWCAAETAVPALSPSHTPHGPPASPDGGGVVVRPWQRLHISVLYTQEPTGQT